MNLQEEIAKTAYEFYEKSGRIKGRDFDNWVKAERLVLVRHASQDIEEPEEMSSNEGSGEFPPFQEEEGMSETGRSTTSAILSGGEECEKIENTEKEEENMPATSVSGKLGQPKARVRKEEEAAKYVTSYGHAHKKEE